MIGIVLSNGGTMKELHLAKYTDELKQMIAKHPDLPIVILADEDSVCFEGRWTFCSDIWFEITDILDCDYYDYSDCIITDRGRLKDVIEDNLYEEYHTKSDEEYESAIKAKMEELEPYWKKVIAIYATN